MNHRTTVSTARVIYRFSLALICSLGSAPALAIGAEFTIGGAIYRDLTDPLSTGLAGVTVILECNGGFADSAATAGAQGLWFITGVQEDTCRVTPSMAGYCFEHVVAGAPDGQASIAITVDAGHQGPNQSIQFLAIDEANCGDLTGACCAPDGTCQDMTELNCVGDYQGDGTECASTTCPAPPEGACCGTNNQCAITTEASCAGRYIGDDTICDPDPCVDCFIVGGAVYADCDNPLSSGIVDVEICVTCDSGFDDCTSSVGSLGLWSLPCVTTGPCTVSAASGYCHVADACPAVECSNLVQITVGPGHQPENQSVQFWFEECTVDADCDDGNPCSDDVCDGGVCWNPPLPFGTPCGDSGSTACTNPDTCNGAGACLPNHEPVTTVCRPAAGECDVAEFCDGVGNCPADGLRPAGTPCGDPTDTECTNPDTCNGAGVCIENDAPAGLLCGDPTNTICTGPDTCDGAGVCLPNNEPVTTVCRPAAGECDVDEFCDGAGGCPADAFKPPSTACGDATNTTCNGADTCDGDGNCGDNFALDGTTCDDGILDTCDDQCVAGVCIGMSCPTRESMAIHGAVGEVGLVIPEDGSFTEPRSSGVQKLVVTYDGPVTAAGSFATITAACDVNGQPVDLSGIIITTEQGAANEVVITFSPQLPGSGLEPGTHDPARYRVVLSGVGGATGDTSREFSVVLGDAFGMPIGTGDARVNAQDNGFVRSLAAAGINPIDPNNPSHVRSDVFTNGAINAQDNGLVRALAAEGLNGQGLSLVCP